MRTIVMLLSLLALSCRAQKSQPCASPSLLNGAFIVSTQNEKMWLAAKFWYDAVGQRLRVMEAGVSENKTFTIDSLLLFKEHTMFAIDESKRQCTKMELKSDFHPMAVPKDASFAGQYVLGSSSGPGMGVVVDSWKGKDPSGKEYHVTVTDIGCIPVSAMYQDPKYGWVLVNVVNNIIGNPSAPPKELNVPDFCHHAETMRARDGRQPPSDFFSLVMKRN